MLSDSSKSILQVLLTILIGLIIFYALLVLAIVFSITISSSEVGIIALTAIALSCIRHRRYHRRSQPG